MEGARPATGSDVPRLAELFRAAVAGVDPGRGGDVFVTRELRAEPVEDSLRASLADPGESVWAGTIDDVVVGYAAGRVERLRDGRLLGVIGELFVEAPARGVGVGEALMGVLLDWFRAQGCAGIDALALPGDRHTKNFFEASGFSARLLVMHQRAR